MERQFTASFDLTAKIMTICIVLVVVTIITGVWIGYAIDGPKLGLPIYITAMLGTIMAVAYAYHPKGYEVTETEIVIVRAASKVHIPLGTVKDVKILPKVSKRGLIRVMGNGGLFGYYGEFRNKDLGTMEWYLTKRSNVVLVQTDKAKILLSPNHPEDFVKLLRSPQAPVL